MRGSPGRSRRTCSRRIRGKTFSRHLPYNLMPSPTGTSLHVDDDVSFEGLGKLAAPIASRDIKKRWETSLAKLKAATEAGQ
jgi:hypothetical protein